jgi:glycine oxidase
MRIVVHGAGIFGSVGGLGLPCRRGAQVTVVDPDGPGAGPRAAWSARWPRMCPRRGTPRRRCSSKASRWPERFWTEVAEVSAATPAMRARDGCSPWPERRWSGRGRGPSRRRSSGRAATVGGSGRRPLRRPRPQPHRPRHLRHLTARLHPRRAVAALVAALAGGGAIASTPRAMRSFMPPALPGLLELKGLAGDRIIGAGVKGQAAVLDATSADQPQLYAEGLHIVPHADGTVASAPPPNGNGTTPPPPMTQLDDVIARARAACPALRDAPVIERWAGIRPRAGRARRSWGITRCGRGVHRQWRLQDRLRHGAAWWRTLMADLVVDSIDRIPPEFRPEASLPKAPPPCAGRPSAPPAREISLVGEPPVFAETAPRPPTRTSGPGRTRARNGIMQSRSGILRPLAARAPRGGRHDRNGLVPPRIALVRLTQSSAFFSTPGQGPCCIRDRR